MPEEGTSAFALEVMILSEKEQRPAARCHEEIVVYDYRVGKKTAFPGYMLEGFKKIYAEQEAERRRQAGRVVRLLEDVKALERETWDREGAVEDMGTPSS